MLLFNSAKKERLLYVIAGESNSGGFGQNSDIPLSELSPNPFVKIWNNTTNIFESLQIGSNNLLGHEGLSNLGFNLTRHGLERSLALDARSEFFVLKSGQGGSRINMWVPGATYENTSVVEPYALLATRYNAAAAALSENGKYRVKPVLIWWLGINDALDGNTSIAWRIATESHFARMRVLMGASLPIFPLKIMTNNPSKILINQHIESLSNISGVYPIDVSAADNQVLSDTNHWSATGLRTCGLALKNKLTQVIGPWAKLRD